MYGLIARVNDSYAVKWIKSKTFNKNSSIVNKKKARNVFKRVSLSKELLNYLGFASANLGISYRTYFLNILALRQRKTTENDDVSQLKEKNILNDWYYINNEYASKPYVYAFPLFDMLESIFSSFHYLLYSRLFNGIII